MREKDQDPIYRHVFKEDGLSKKDYESENKHYGLKKATKVQRGLCFRTRSEFERFKDVLDSGDYFPSNPESFTRNKNTALEFAKQKKTFFAFTDKDIFLENEYKKITNERIAGYAGVVITLEIPAGEGVDINASEYSAEDEIVFMTDKPLKYSYEVFDSYETELKKNPIDINAYMKEHSINEDLAQYLISNHAKEFEPGTQNHILDQVLLSYGKQKESSMFLVDEGKNLLLGYEKNIGIKNDEEKVDKEIIFMTRPVFSYYKKGVFTDESVKERICDFANHILTNTTDFIDMEMMYDDPTKGFDIYYDTESLNQLTVFAGKEVVQDFKNVVVASQPKSYNDLNDEIRTLNYDNSLSKTERSKQVENITKNITKLWTNASNVITSERVAKERLEDFEKRSENIKTRGKKLKNR